MMRQIHLFCLMTALLLPGWGVLPAAAQGQSEGACYAEYKARKGPPLELHYGIAALEGPACTRRGRAERELTDRLDQGGWQLLTLMKVFVVGEDISARAFRKKEADAGPYFLRY